ncbi:hypothetical protein EDB89DRAFT_716628 [Lactarius sanguifluus]|nr:hypothetical protein EDB89DRAFT_716628 [Lactarius sanguifluus]
MMYLSEAEKEDKEKGGYRGNPRLYWSVLGHRCALHYRKLQATISRFQRYDQYPPYSNISTTCQHLQRDTSRGPYSAALQINSFCRQGQRDVVPHFGPQLDLRALTQQWARRYLQLAQHRGAPHKRARMRAYIFYGIKGFKMTRAIEAMPAFLHLSVFLFFVGLVNFLIPINTTVAYFNPGWIALFAVAYAILTILPNLRLNCPYRTPLSGITWRLSQISLLGTFLAILGIEGPFHRLLLSLWRWNRRQVMETSGPTKWRDTLEKQVAMRRKWLKDGLRRSVKLSATDAPSTMDKDALEWMLEALDEDKEVEDFAERIPGFFDSRAVSDPTSAILFLMANQPESTAEPILGSRLRDLLKTCIPGTSPLTDEKRKSRLRVCSKYLWSCGRGYNRLKNSEPLPPYVRIVFANPDMTHRFQAEEDLAARVIGGCFGALVAKKLSADIDWNYTQGVRVKEGELACLSAILGIESSEMMLLLGQPGAIELASIVSLISASADSLVGDAMPSDVLDVFKETLGVLSEPLLAGGQANVPQPQVEHFHKIYSEAPNWLKDELKPISDRMLTAIVAFPEPQAAHECMSHGLIFLMSHSNRARIGRGLMGRRIAVLAMA